MQQEEYVRQGVKCVRIDKRKARIKFNEGKTIFLIPDMMRLENAWQSPHPISNNGLQTIGASFDNLVDCFMYCNCDFERGRGVKYFIAENDLK